MEQSRKQDKKNRFLFVCVENAGRSQMAEGFLKGRTKPISKINPVVVQAMDEVGVDVK